MRFCLFQCFVVAFLVILAGNRPALAGKFQSDSDQEIATLIEQLGDSKATKRQEAANRLAEIGQPAKTQLEVAINNKDLEIRSQARRLLAALQENELEARIKAFLNREPDASLPGWEKWRQIMGDDVNSRTFFVEVQRAEQKLLEAYADGAKDINEQFVKCCEAYNIMQGKNLDTHGVEGTPVPLGSIAALLLMACDKEVISDTESLKVGWLLRHPRLVQSLTAKNKQAIHKLLMYWIARPVSQPNSSEGYVKRDVSMTYDLKKGAHLWIHWLPEDDFVKADLKKRDLGQGWLWFNHPAYAVLAIGKLGDQQHIERLEGLLNNQVEFFEGARSDVQLRDFALMALINISGQQLKDYELPDTSFDPAKIWCNIEPRVRFESDESRQRAIAKWRTWATENLKDQKSKNR